MALNGRLQVRIDGFLYDVDSLTIDRDIVSAAYSHMAYLTVCGALPPKLAGVDTNGTTFILGNGDTTVTWDAYVEAVEIQRDLTSSGLYTMRYTLKVERAK